MTQIFKARETFTRDRLKFAKPKAWSHMDALRDLKGKKVILRFDADSFVIGVLREADQFTVQLEDSYKSITTYFKGHILSFAETSAT